jgi:hypothetical protein
LAASQLQPHAEFRQKGKNLLQLYPHVIVYELVRVIRVLQDLRGLDPLCTDDRLSLFSQRAQTIDRNLSQICRLNWKSQHSALLAASISTSGSVVLAML